MHCSAVVFRARAYGNCREICFLQVGPKTCSDFAAELCRLATRCQFKEQHLDEPLHDRFICGLHLESVQKKLLLEKDLTMASVLERANCISSAERTSRAMNSSKVQNQPVHIVWGKQTSGRRLCYRCGRNGHNSDQCRFREANCHTCGKVGHIAPVCMSGQKKEHQKFNNGPKSNAHHKGKQRDLDTNATEVSHSDEEPLFTVEEKSHPLIIMKLKLK